jgi:uncharacterized protein (TIGR00299 family) protein
MNKSLYFECGSGISGDMTVAALLDLGADPEVLRKALDSLPLDGYRTEITRVKKSGLDCCDFQVILDEAHENHDHDMEYLYGHTHTHTHTHTEYGSHEPHQHHSEHHHAGHHSHHHCHRGLAEVEAILRQSAMTEHAKEIADRIFTILGEAEAKAHGSTLQEVHFHEVGAVDSIVDIAAAAVCFDNLGIDQVIIPRISEGCGTVRCAHGILPIPVPAVANIAAANGLILHQMNREGEYVTPTGAAIAAALMTSAQLPETYRVLSCGMGAGKREYEAASVLRVYMIESADGSDSESDRVLKLECNLDDCPGEELGFVMEQLLEQGARDVNFTPIFMKKNRPAYQLNVLCSPQDGKQMEEIIFAQTTTIGIRRVLMERTILRRKEDTVDTTLGLVAVKRTEFEGRTRIYPEYDSIAAICRNTGLRYPDVYRRVIIELEALESGKHSDTKE